MNAEPATTLMRPAGGACCASVADSAASSDASISVRNRKHFILSSCITILLSAMETTAISRSQNRECRSGLRPIDYGSRSENGERRTAQHGLDGTHTDGAGGAFSDLRFDRGGPAADARR